MIIEGDQLVVRLLGMMNHDDQWLDSVVTRGGVRNGFLIASCWAESPVRELFVCLERMALQIAVVSI